MLLPAVCMISLPYVNSNWSPEMAKLGVDLRDLDLWPLTLTFCMDIQGWVSSGRNLFLPGHPEKSGRNLFLPVLSGPNWKKLDKTVKDVRNVGWKYLSYLISYKRLWLKMHLVNWYCLKHYAKASTIFDLFLPVLSGQNWKKLDDNWGNFKRCQKYWKKLIIILIFSQKVMVTNTLSWLLLFRNII